MSTYLSCMKIATWNLECADPNTSQAQRQRQWLDRINADIWVLTETNDDISPGSAYQGVASGQSDCPRGSGKPWVQIWVRNGEISPLPTADEARTVCARVTLTTGLDYLVYGTVLPGLDSSWRSHPAAQGEAFLAALALQQADWLRLRSTYPETTLIVAGDFNQDLGDMPYYGSRRNKQALRQALATVNLDGLTAGDNDPVRRLLGSQHASINHICLAGTQGQTSYPTFTWPNQLEELRGLADQFGVGVEVNG